MSPRIRLDQLQRLGRLPLTRQLIQQGAPAAAVQAAQLGKTRGKWWFHQESPRKTIEK